MPRVLQTGLETLAKLHPGVVGGDCRLALLSNVVLCNCGGKCGGTLQSVFGSLLGIPQMVFQKGQSGYALGQRRAPAVPEPGIVQLLPTQT